MERHFLPPGSEMNIIVPKDWTDEPQLLNMISDKLLRDWVKDLNYKWRLLIRNYNQSVLCSGCITSSVPLHHPFVIPGGRFREFYYWDTFWIVEGLLSCGMYSTVEGIIRNFMEMINVFGFVPNCSRIYCLNRSQPPMFPRIVASYYEKTKNITFIKEVIPFLDTEYNFWMRFRSIKLNLADDTQVVMNIYKANSYFPRPESFVEDYSNASIFTEEYDRQKYYDNVASIAESGWDFSSRWYFDQEITSSDILRIIPVDLNSFMLKNEFLLQNLHSLIPNEEKHAQKAIFYKIQHENRAAAIDRVFWSESDLCWNDFDYKEMKQRKGFYVSNLLPLLDSKLKNEEKGSEILERYYKNLLSYPAGIPISAPEKSFSQQQWDYPNAWAPYEYFTATFLHEVGKKDLALKVCQRWINATYCGYALTGGYLYEKYHAEQLGRPGVGGEYLVQEGFGWTNGVVFKMIEMFSKELFVSPELSKSCKKQTAQQFLYDAEAVDQQALPSYIYWYSAVLAIMAVFMLVIIQFIYKKRLLSQSRRHIGDTAVESLM